MLKRIICLICLLMILFLGVATFSQTTTDSEFIPKWRVGDSWNIIMRGMRTAEYGSRVGSVERPGEPLYIHFEVVDLKWIDGDMCYIVEVTYKDPTNEYNRNAVLQLYVREDGFTLKKVLEIAKGRNGSKDHIDNYHDNGYDFVIFDMPFNVSIPCDFPEFPATNSNEERTVKVPSGLTVTQRATFTDENIAKIELSTKTGTRTIRTTQIWEKGKPWWSSLNKTLTYYDYSAGKEKTKVEYSAILEGTDLRKPELSLTVNPTILWPPNHEMVEITPIITVTDDRDRYPEINLESITSNEPDDAIGEGDGHTTNDIEITKDNKILLRAERDAKGSGRIYTITYTAKDFSGNVQSAFATVTVPRDERK